MTLLFDYKTFVKQLTSEPGIYQMLNEAGKVLYVGKAKNLNKRVRSYFAKQQTPRIASLVSQIFDIKIITTQTENEALLLENNLIKKLKPRYNILFRDDKSYPYIFISSAHKYPSIVYHRGAKTKKGKYYGPYPSGSAVRHFLNLLQKLFKVRQCSDSFFQNRSRPCMQYQIHRCSAPCVEKISEEAYAESIHLTEMFLQGKSQQLIIQFMEKMERAAQNLNFEAAAHYRDTITSLRQIQEQQSVVLDEGDIDIIAHYAEMHQACVQVMFIRNGRLIGDHSYFCKSPYEQSAAEVFENFLSQFYFDKRHSDDIPKEIIIETNINNKAWLEQALTELKQLKVKIKKPEKGEKLKWLELAKKNAKAALLTRLNQSHSFQQRFQALQKALSLSTLPNQIECFDISHTMGEATVASCVVFTQDGPKKQLYRRYNITNITQGDDYAAMKQVLLRRYQSLKDKEGVMPDIILIDGGKGQLKQAENVLEELQLPEVQLFSICKGPGRKPIYDRILLPKTYQEINLSADVSAFHLLQNLRDEAHRFAISGHIAKREKKRNLSILEGIEGVGQKRRKQLLNYFGGLQGLKNANAEQIAQVPGISLELAKKITDYLKD